MSIQLRRISGMKKYRKRQVPGDYVLFRLQIWMQPRPPVYQRLYNTYLGTRAALKIVIITCMAAGSDKRTFQQ